MTELRIYSVTLAFTPPGPLHTSLVIAQDEANASAMAMQRAMGDLPIVTPLATVLVVPLDADVLRQMLRAIEGRGPGEVVSLVPKLQDTPLRDDMVISDPTGELDGWVIGGTGRPPSEQRAAEILRKHEPDLDAADTPFAKPLIVPCREGEHEWVDKACVRCGSFLVPYQYAENKPIDAADASTFTGRNVDHMWTQYRYGSPEPHDQQFWIGNEQFGPPISEMLWERTGDPNLELCRNRVMNCVYYRYRKSDGDWTYDFGDQEPAA